MKSSFKHLLAGMLLGLLVVIGINASININNPVPVNWSTPSGTNSFGLNSDAMPVIKRLGTNYTGLTTNWVTVTNTLVFKGGILTSIQ
jgi:hypothetical protein